MNNNPIVKITLITLSLTLLTLGIDGVSKDMGGFSFYCWLFLSNLLVIVVLYLYAVKSSYRNNLLWIHLWVIFFAIGHFNILVEALIFNITSRQETLTALLLGLFSSGIITFILYRFLENDLEKKYEDEQLEHRSGLKWMIKILLGNFMYFIFYFIAGLTLSMVYPQLMEFYDDKLPPMHLIIVTNLCFRGFIFVGIAILIDYTVLSSALYKGILTGLIFAVLGGIAPLIVPNELMPQNIRIAHGFEVGISNFVYGWILHYMLLRKKIKLSA